MLSLLTALVAALALLSAPAAAQHMPHNYTINVDPENAEGRILVNGVPIQRFGGADDMGLAVGTGMWMVDGENTVVIETRPKAGKATTRITILKSMAEPPVLEKTIEGAGTAEWKVSATGMPRWSWFAAETYQGDPKELLAAVAALHAAYAKQDLPTIYAMRQASDDDFTIVAGPLTDAEKQQEREFLQRGRLAPLAARLTVTPYADGKLVTVESDDGLAPIVIAVPDTPIKSEIARYWIKKDGRWQVVR
jgi:hypothetical protein